MVFPAFFPRGIPTFAIASDEVRVRRSEKEQQLELLKKVKTMEDLKEVPQVWLFKDGISLQRSNLM